MKRTTGSADKQGELKPCPFCGHEAEQDDEIADDAVVCGNGRCLMSGYPMRRDDWNKRAALSSCAAITDEDFDSLEYYARMVERYEHPSMRPLSAADYRMYSISQRELAKFRQRLTRPESETQKEYPVSMTMDKYHEFLAYEAECKLRDARSASAALVAEAGPLEGLRERLAKLERERDGGWSPAARSALAEATVLARMLKPAPASSITPTPKWELVPESASIGTEKNLLRSEAMRGGKMAVVVIWKGRFYKYEADYPPFDPDASALSATEATEEK